MNKQTRPLAKGLLAKTILAIASAWAFGGGVSPRVANAQNDRCDPAKVSGAAACAKCHVDEVSAWKQTPHFRTFDELGRRPEAKQICKNLGLRSVKRSDVCIDCHFTVQTKNGKDRPVSGVSCESCHGAAQDWIGVHNDYGGPTATRESEDPDHAIERFTAAMESGMRNTRNLYHIASRCFDCHTVPNETLVNVGGHTPGSEDFELVRWSQGQIRHNFLRVDGQSNAASSTERLRVMLIVGLMADLETSTRATALATEKSKYGITVAARTGKVAVRLFDAQKRIHDPDVQSALVAFSRAELKLNNGAALLAIADEIRIAGVAFANRHDGSQLAALDPLLPPPNEYR